MRPTARRYLACLSGIILIQAVFFYASFCANFTSTLSEWSAFGVNWPLQLYYNFLHGRPFQSSLYAAPIGGPAVGFVDNPYAYIHANVVHANFLPYAFAYLWALHPTLGMLYGIIIVWNLAAGAWLTRLILKRLAPKDYRPKLVFALSIFFGAGLLSIMDQFAQFLLFVGPFMMAAYYFFLTKRRFLFLAAVAAICLIGEDAAMMAVSFMAYLFFFEPEAEGRSFALTGAAVAVPYTLLVLLVVQPASRAELTLMSSSNMANVFKQVLDMTPGLLARNLKTMWPLFTLFPAFAMAGLVFGWPSAPQAALIAGLALVSTAPYWGEAFARGGGHHILPPFVSCYLALLRMLGYGRAEGEDWLRRRVAPVALAATAIFLLFSFRVESNLLPSALKPALYRLTGKVAKAKALELSLRVEEASNRSVIATVRSLPPEKSLTYLVNNRATGFILDRSDIWQCHDVLLGRYAFDQSDFFVVQKDGIDLTCCLEASSGDDVRAMFAKSAYDFRNDCPMTPAVMKRIRDDLAGAGTHRVAKEDEHVLLLENLHPVRFEVPATTMGFGWTRNLFKKAAYAAPPAAAL